MYNREQQIKEKQYTFFKVKVKLFCINVHQKASAWEVVSQNCNQ